MVGTVQLVNHSFRDLVKGTNVDSCLLLPLIRGLYVIKRFFGILSYIYFLSLVVRIDTASLWCFNTSLSR